MTLEILVVFALTALNGFFAMSETAMVRRAGRGSGSAWTGAAAGRGRPSSWPRTPTASSQPCRSGSRS